MTSQSSVSSLSKQRQSWLDLVSQASPPAGETAVVCSVQVHSHHSPQVETEEETALENLVSQDSSDSTGSNEESCAAEGDDQGDVLGTRQGEFSSFFSPFTF